MPKECERMDKCVLIIDDNENDVLITRRALSQADANISSEVACNGEEGLLRLRKGGPPALILLDLKMPGMGGIEVLRSIRSDHRLKDIPVVVLTHSALESDVKASYEAGANEVLHKAFDLDQFRGDILRILDNWVKS